MKKNSSFDESTSPDQWTAEVLRNVAESVSPMLKWTADSPSSHDTGKMPVLDICLWTEETDSGTSFQYEFYSKPMANPVTVPANSAISQGVKLATYRQEVVRVLSNTSYSLPWARKAELLSDMAWRIQKAGYGIGFIVTVLNGGIRAHLKCLSNQQMKGIPLHRPKDWEGRRVTRRKDNWYQPANDVKKYSSVVFVPATPGSALTNILQQQEERIIRGEKLGSNLWRRQDCRSGTCW